MSKALHSVRDPGHFLSSFTGRQGVHEDPGLSTSKAHSGSLHLNEIPLWGMRITVNAGSRLFYSGLEEYRWKSMM